MSGDGCTGSRSIITGLLKDRRHRRLKSERHDQRWMSAWAAIAAKHADAGTMVIERTGDSLPVIADTQFAPRFDRGHLRVVRHGIVRQQRAGRWQEHPKHHSPGNDCRDNRSAGGARRTQQHDILLVWRRCRVKHGS